MKTKRGEYLETGDIPSPPLPSPGVDMSKYMWRWINKTYLKELFEKNDSFVR